MSLGNTTTPYNPSEPSGTLVTRDDNVDFGSQSNPDTASTEPAMIPREGEEQALESHEVIELQAFSERKNWIEEKIKLLEKMPPIEVFVGLDAIRSSTEEVPGLPTRAELQQWLVEHDTIEKETEIFDSGELKKLKKFTKAATQRNLSPQDTDLIELTLTTIYELDKLLHLLRDRSENLDLLGVRLTWEENRVAAWVDRRNILQDLHAFLATRARWSPSVYDPITKSEELSNRRGSIASIASESSASSSRGFSRSARFKLAELLSRDAAQFVGRVTSLRHGKISAAGKALDKLIDNSRKPLPEEFLDEQDKIEEKGIKEMENINKFVMNVVMQWRKADELYVETIKDQVAASNLLEEIEATKLYSPSARQSTSFVTRADTLVKRLSLRGNVASSSSTFPCPVHPLFPDQPASNTSLAQTLSSEITTARDLARKVDVVAKEYRSTYEAVRDVEILTQTANDLSATFTTLIDHLDVGVPTDDGDGTSPDLTSEACLEPIRHSVFLALLPSILEESEKATDEAGRILRSSHGALLRLDAPGIDSLFKTNAASEIQRLIEMRDQNQRSRDDAIARVSRLRAARRIWAVMGEGLQAVEDIRRQVGGAMELQRWKPQTSSGEAPLTPESPSTIPPSDDVVPTSVMTRLDDMLAKFVQDIEEPLASMSSSLEAPLNQWLTHSYKGLTGLLESVRQMTSLLESIRNQAEIMAAVQNEFNEFQFRMEDLKISFDSNMEQVLSAKLVDEELVQADCELKAKTAGLRDVVQAFIDGLTKRIPFVAQRRELSRLKPTFVKRRFSSVDLKLGAPQQQPVIELPFELSSLDDVVRADSNSFTIRLSGDMQALVQKGDHFRLAQMAKDLDLILSSTVDNINRVTQELVAFKCSFSLIMDHGTVTEPLQSLRKDVEESLQTHRATIARSFSPIRDLLRRMESAPGAHDPAVYEVIYLARNRDVDDAELKFNAWNEDMASFRARIVEAERVEAQRLERERMAEQHRIQAEKERAAVQEAKAEQERLEVEEKLRLERMEEERRIHGEREREAREEAERLRIERERLEAERLAIEEARLAQEQVERERAVIAEAERLRVEQARLEAEESRKAEELQLQVAKAFKEAEDAEKLKLERQKLDEEKLRVDTAARHLHAEKERMAAEERERLRLEQERLEALEKVQVEQERRAEELQIQQAEADHAKNESERLKTERLRLETEAKLRVDKARGEHRLQSGREDAGKLRMKRESLIAEEASRTGKAEQISRTKTRRKNEVVPGKKLGPKANNGHAKQADEDVFGFCVAPSSTNHVRTDEMRDLQAHILALRKRLRSVNLNEVSRPSSSSSPSTHLPTQDQAKKLDGQFSLLSKEIARLPSTVDDVSVDVELRSLRTEADTSVHLMQRVFQLASMSDAVYLCDAALSDLLEHIDSYPAVPLGSLSSSHNTQLNLPPEEQLSARLSFTRSAIDEMTTRFSSVADDNRAIVERKRLLQTWSELEDMGNDRVSGTKSRSTSAVGSDRNSSGRNSRTSGIGSLPPVQRTRSDYSNLSVGSSRRGRFLTPSHAVSRRAVSGSAETRSRPASQMSNLSNRSVSGPFPSSLFSSTYASRQRTSSLSSSTSISTPNPPPSLLTRAQTSQKRRSSSPTWSEASFSRSAMGPSRSSISTSTSTWARAPRQSFSTLPKASPPRKRTPFMPKKTYVADPRNKLDIAVGDVVNKLPVNINIEVVAETWKDQSGKYWIGDQDPKLCFCRILRSQTVMVRVGGGWSELSKFIKDHFADLFRIVPESPSYSGAREEKWISSTTLFEAPERTETPPRTPEPTGAFVPSFSLLTPSGQSPRSLKSNSSSGSPLTALQFMRRADGDSPGLRPVTPSKAPTLRSRASTPHTPARISVWRP